MDTITLDRIGILDPLDHAITRQEHQRTTTVPLPAPIVRRALKVNLGLPDADWMASGACNGMDPDIWFPHHPVHEPDVDGCLFCNKPDDEHDPRGLQAQAICATCPIIERCLDYALTNRILHGTWGGQSERERKRRLHLIAAKRCRRCTTLFDPAHGREVFCNDLCRQANRADSKARDNELRNRRAQAARRERDAFLGDAAPTRKTTTTIPVKEQTA